MCILYNVSVHVYRYMWPIYVGDREYATCMQIWPIDVGYRLYVSSIMCLEMCTFPICVHKNTELYVHTRYIPACIPLEGTHTHIHTY